MIIDSHAHYSHRRYEQTFRYLTQQEGQYALAEGSRKDMLRAMQQANIACCIEPSISLSSCEGVLAFCARAPHRFFPAIGVHPTRCPEEPWGNRKKLVALSAQAGIVAIGETGLDYHHARKEQHRLTQHLWFLYQLDLAWRRKLPVILHIREAYGDALRLLRLHPARRLGGVVHCFNSNWKTAQKYLALGYYLGIGGSLLQEGDKAQALLDVVSRTPLDRILVETDAPYVLPYCKDLKTGNARNSSLILPKVIRTIAECKGLSPEQAEAATAENAIRLFSLPFPETIPEVQSSKGGVSV